MAFVTVKENLQQRLSDLRKFLKVAVEGGSIDFARSILGKSLFVFMKVSRAVEINAESYLGPTNKIHFAQSCNTIVKKQALCY